MKPLMGVGIALALMALGGCTQNEKAQVRQDVDGVGRQVSQTAKTVQSAAAEATLASKVKAALGLRKGLEGDHIQVEVHGTDVILKGDVQSQEQADLAEKTAGQTEGVTSVQNNLTMRVPAKTVTGG